MNRNNLKNTVVDAVKTMPGRYKPWHTVIIGLLTIGTIIFTWGQSSGKFEEKLLQHDKRLAVIDSTLKRFPFSPERLENLNTQLEDLNKALENFATKLKEHDEEFKDIWKNYQRRNINN